MCHDRDAETEVAQALRRVAYQIELETNVTERHDAVTLNDLLRILRTVAEELEQQPPAPSNP